MEKNQLTPSQGTELARLATATQVVLFAMIARGQCPTYARLRAAADGFVSAAGQPSMFALAPEQTAEKVDPRRAANIVEQLALIRKDLARMEKVLQASVAQGEMLAA
jgi:hypothetical protein